ncbi:MAG: AraC family transcriptional regulator [Chitinophagaceae bacterium]
MYNQFTATKKAPPPAPVTQKVLRQYDLPLAALCHYTGKEHTSMYVSEYTLIAVRDGEMAIRYGDMKYTIKSNQLLLLRKGVFVEFGNAATDTTGDALCYISFFLRENLLMEFVKIAGYNCAAANECLPITMNNTSPRLSDYMYSLQPYFTEPDKINCSLLKIKLLELLFELSATDTNILQQLLFLRPQYQANITETVEENLLNGVSLSRLATLSGRSLSSFKRDFYAIYNMPPSAWIRRRKLEKAKELFSQTSMSVTDICYSLGFENLAHFSRLFKSHYGAAPSYYTKSLKHSV